MGYFCKVSKVLVLLVCCFIAASACAQEIDGETIRIGIAREEQYTTLRLQCFSGDWRMLLTPAVASASAAASATTSITASKTAETPAARNLSMAPVKELLAEGEDAALMLVPKGIVARLSTEKDLDRGYSKVVVNGGGLVSLEIPGLAPFILQGEIEINHDGSSFSIINTVNFHQFVVSCTSKMAICNEPEALRAQIIMVRSRLKYLKENSLHKDQPYEVCDLDHCLPFSGCGYNRELIDILTTMSRNQILTHGGKVIMPRFHNTCGGKISSAKDVYGVDNEPYHIAHADVQDGKGSENCFHSPGFHWTIELQKFDILDFLSLAFAGGADRIYGSWEPEKIGENGRIYQVLLRGRKPKSVSGIEFLQQLQSHFGPNSIKSMKFNMDILKRTIIFRGMGQGDGVGMCLYGADGMAKKGLKFTDILKFYYPNTEIK